MTFQRKIYTALTIFTVANFGIVSAFAQSPNKTVHLLTWGGSVQKSFEQGGLADAFEKDTGYKVVVVPKPTGGEILATATAQKDKPQRPIA